MADAHAAALNGSSSEVDADLALSTGLFGFAASTFTTTVTQISTGAPLATSTWSTSATLNPYGPSPIGTTAFHYGTWPP
jgi:hypothetical protein